MAKLNITQAAKTAGIAKGTLYNHIKQGKVSVEVDDKGGKVIDTSELQRVYGELKNDTPVKERSSERAIEHDKTDKIERILCQQISDLKQQVEVLLQDKEDLKDALKEEREDRKKLYLLLEDKRQKTEEKSQSNRWLVYGLSSAIALVSSVAVYTLWQLWGS